MGSRSTPKSFNAKTISLYQRRERRGEIVSKSNPEFKLPSVTASDNDIKNFITHEISFLSEASDDSALSRIFALITYVNSLSESRRAGIFDKLIEYLHKLKKKLDSIGKTWGVDSYTISVGWLKIDLSLTFKIPET